MSAVGATLSIDSVRLERPLQGKMDLAPMPQMAAYLPSNPWFLLFHLTVRMPPLTANAVSTAAQISFGG